MLKPLNCLSILSLVVLAGCVEERIDLERDVPDRAKLIAQQHSESIRSSVEDPLAKQKYKELAELQKMQKNVEIRIAELNSAGSTSGAICPLCRKRYDIQAQKAALVKRKKKSTKSKKARKVVYRKKSSEIAAPQTTPAAVENPPMVVQQPPAYFEPQPGGFVPPPQPQVVTPYQPQ
ncbi:MAG: hypothetical protein LBJ89_03405 [Holosporales bacterium]|jgi:hypothetical protein|nr:hypothetical protein [Holosporales bacterium]